MFYEDRNVESMSLVRHYKSTKGVVNLEYLDLRLLSHYN